MFQLISGAKGQLYRRDKVYDKVGKFYLKSENALTAFYGKINEYNDMNRINLYPDSRLLKKAPESEREKANAYMLYENDECWHGLFELKFEDDK